MLKNDQEIVKKPKNHDFIPGYRFSVPTPLKDCQADRDPDDLQRAVNVYAYHSFKHETYKFIARQHGVVSLRFEHVEPPVQPKRTQPCIHDRGEYDKNSLCSIFEYVERKRFERKYSNMV